MSSVPEFVDPYVYAGTSVLKNKRGFRSKQTLDAFGRRSSLARRIEMAQNPLPGGFDFDHFLRIHKMLFGDVYDWAGQVRTVDIVKGESHFQPTKLISTGSNHIFTWLQEDSDLLQTDIDVEMFIFQASRLLSDLNYLHPFREGNGRAQRAFLDVVAQRSGRQLAWRNISAEEYLQASIRSFEEGDGKAFEALFPIMLQPPSDGLTILDEGAYTVLPPSSKLLEGHTGRW